MAHEFARALQEAGGIGEGCALEETYVYVGGEDVHVGEGGVSEAGGWAAVVEEFADFVAAVSHNFKPLTGDGSQFTFVIFQPCVDGRIAGDGAVESE